jgi:hypothetical protein
MRIFSPAGMEQFFLESGARADGEVDPSKVLASAVKHGWEFIR